MKPDLVINGMTSMDDLIDLLEDGKTELYTLQTILDYLMKLGIPEAGNIILTDMIKKGNLWQGKVFKTSTMVMWVRGQFRVAGVEE